tara:strand:- start:750 stop:1784 length:1035 start_codon:yes stop_codon:yes gene_type:complete
MLEKWKSILISGNDPIINAINILNKTGLMLIIVCDQNNKLLGTISDGDIRKGLSKGFALNDKVSLIYNKNPKYVYESTSLKIIKNLFNNRVYKGIPVIDKQKNVVGCYFEDNFFTIEEKPPFLIMAGGYGKRLKKLTENIPKPMIKINQKPILEHIINKAKEENFTNIFISTHYKSEIIENHFGNGNKFDVTIEYIKEEKPLGTGGSFKSMCHFDGPIIITNGDIISKIGYQKLLDFHNLNQGIATMAVIKHEIKNPFGVVKHDGIRLLDFEEKPSWFSYVNAGIYVVESKASTLIKKNQYTSMPSILKKLIDKKNDVFIFHLHEDWVDIGTPNELKKIKKVFK